MKKLTLLTALIFTLLTGHQATAQVSVSVNIGVQPVWGPVGYDRVDYYYLPDVDAYYDVPSRVFVYNDGGIWVRRPALPPAFAGYDLYHGYKVVINEPTPWVRNTIYHDRYISYRGNHSQPFIRDSREQRYYVIKDHPMHGQYREVNHPVNRGVSNTPVNHGGGNNVVQHNGGGNRQVQHSNGGGGARPAGNGGGHGNGGGGHGNGGGGGHGNGGGHGGGHGH